VSTCFYKARATFHLKDETVTLFSTGSNLIATSVADAFHFDGTYERKFSLNISEQLSPEKAID